MTLRPKTILALIVFLGSIIVAAKAGTPPPGGPPISSDISLEPTDSAKDLTCDQPDTLYYKSLYVKTNCTALVLLIANAAVEGDINPHWSWNLPVNYSAWNYFRYNVKFRTFSFFPELRYWLRADNQGWFFGPHVGVAWYNLAVGGDSRTQDHNAHSPALGGGIGAGFRKPISRNGRWFVECAIGIGVYATNYDKFHNERNGRRTVVHHRGCYVGPDIISVSIAYRFNLKRR